MLERIELRGILINLDLNLEVTDGRTKSVAETPLLFCSGFPDL
jgi:hypothetical protein